MKPDSPETRREALMDLIKKHLLAEVAQDVDGVMATLCPSPRFEIHPLGYVLTSAAAVSEFYRRTLPMFDKYSPAGTSATFGGEDSHGTFIGTNEIITKDFVVYTDRDGSQASVKCLAMFVFDPASGLLEGEQIFFSGTGAKLIGDALGDDFRSLPGVELFR